MAHRAFPKVFQMDGDIAGAAGISSPTVYVCMLKAVKEIFFN